MLDNITRDFERDSAQDQLLLGLTEGSRASLGNLQAAVEVLDDPGLDARNARALPGRRARRGAGDGAAHPGAGGAQHPGGRRRAGRWRTCSAPTSWPRRCGASRPCAPCAPARQEVDAALWLKVDSFALLQALSYLASRLVDEFEVRALTPAPAAVGAAAPSST